MIMSTPAFFNAAGNLPPEFEQVKALVKGLFVTTMYRHPVGTGVAVNGPEAITNLFWGDSGSTLGSISSIR
jgi:hypothetical protein